MNNAKPKDRKTPRWRILKRIAVGVFGLWLAINGLFWCVQEWFLIEAHRDSNGYEKMDFMPSYNEYLKPQKGLLSETEKSDPTVEVAINFQKYDSLRQPARGKLFYLHGNRGSIERCRFEIKPFLDAGYDVWTMDYRGFGESKGQISETNLLADAQMVYQEISKTEQIDIIWGRSFGSCAATYLAKENEPKRLVLETPYWSLPDAGCHRFPILIPELFRYRLPTHEYLPYVKCPIRLIHGNIDEKIYYGSSVKLKKQGDQNGQDIKLYTIENGKHNFRPSTLNPSPAIDKAFSDALSECLDLTPKVP